MAAFDSCGHCRGHSQRTMRLAEVVIREVERDRSFKVFKLLAESVGQPCESAAVHPERVILLLDVAGCDSAHVWHSVDDCALCFHDFCRAIPTGGVFVEIDHAVGFYELGVVNLRPKAPLNGFWIDRKSTRLNSSHLV